MKTKIRLRTGERLELNNSSTKGPLQETDIDTYDIVDSLGNVVGSVVHTDHTAIKGFRRTQTVLQRDALGVVVVDESW